MMSSGANSNSLPSSASATGNNGQAPVLKTYFKTPEGKYKLRYEKTHPAGRLPYSHSKTVTQLTLAHLMEKPAETSSQSSSSSGMSSVVRSAAARLLGSADGVKGLGFVGGTVGNKPVIESRVGSFDCSSSSSLIGNTNFDGPGTYLIFNVGDTLFICDLNSQDKDPIKSIQFSNANPICHAFDPDAQDGHDLLIGLSSGDVYSASLRQQLHDVGKKLIGAQFYNKDVSSNGRCTCIAWVPNGDGSFAVAHSDGQLFKYEKHKDSSSDHSFSVLKDQPLFSVSNARYSKFPVARWQVCQGSINEIAFSADGAYLATVGRDGFLRVFQYKNEQLICGGKSYYGALLCCDWSKDGKYILTGGEDDLVQVWSLEDRKVVAWGEGHNSWVSAVAFDTYWQPPHSDEPEEHVVYRFGSVGQDGQLLLWELEIDELVVPVRRAPGGSPTFGTGSSSASWDNASPEGSLRPAPSIRDVPKLSPAVAHRVHIEPLSGLNFSQDSIITASQEGHLRIWLRPGSKEC